MKIWDIIENGKDGDAYKCTNSTISWNNCIIKVIQTNEDEKEGYKAIVFGEELPIVNNARMKVGTTIPLCGAVIKADWERIVTRRYVSFKEAISAYLEGKTIESLTEKDEASVYATYSKDVPLHDSIDIEEIEEMFWAVRD